MMKQSFWWLVVGSRLRFRRPRWFIPLLVFFAAGLVVASLIYAYVVFEAVSERSNTNVHSYRTH